MTNERRLIDAKELEKVLEKRSDELFDEHFPVMSGTVMGTICYIISAPTVDAVEVVRCGECDQWHDGVCDTFVCDTCGPNFYCANGRRKVGAK